MRHEVTLDERLRQQREAKERLKRRFETMESSETITWGTWTGNTSNRPDFGGILPRISVTRQPKWTWPQTPWSEGEPKVPEWVDQDYIFDWETTIDWVPLTGGWVGHYTAGYQPYQPSTMVVSQRTQDEYRRLLNGR